MTRNQWLRKLSFFFIPLLFISASSLRAAEEKPKDPADEIGKYRREGIDVVQGRLFRKTGRHEFTFAGGVIPNNTFIRYELLQLLYTYHFREGLAFEGNFMEAFHQEKGIISDLENIPCPAGGLFDDEGNEVTECGVKFEAGREPDPLQRTFGGNIVWSPIYGKFSIFSKKIFHFDLYVTAGAGLFDNARSNRFAFNFGGGWKVFVNDWWAVRFEFRNYTVREGAPFSSVVNNHLYSLGFSFFLPPHPQG